MTEHEIRAQILHDQTVENFANRLKNNPDFRKEYVSKISKEYKESSELQKNALDKMFECAKSVIKDEKILGVIKKLALAGITSDDLQILFEAKKSSRIEYNYSSFTKNIMQNLENRDYGANEKKPDKNLEAIYRIGNLDTSL